MPLSVVLDTNVLIAGLRSPRGASYQLLKEIGGPAFRLALSVPLVLEYEAVAKRQARELGLTFTDVDAVIDYICSVGDHRRIFYLWRPLLRDPGDDMVLELAVEAGVDYIVTHNLRDFGPSRQFGIDAIPPKDFLAKLRGPK
jgi:putative PIN family toxin of toxin-antitoxin system